MKRLLLVITLSLWASSAFAVEARDFDTEADAQRYYKLIARLRCLVCQNQSLADSNADLARDMRDKTFELMFEKESSDDDIVNFMLERYGDFVLYRPPFKATTVALWLAPAIALILGLVLVARLAASSTGQSSRAQVEDEKLAAARRLLNDSERVDRDQPR